MGKSIKKISSILAALIGVGGGGNVSNAADNNSSERFVVSTSSDSETENVNSFKENRRPIRLIRSLPSEMPKPGSKGGIFLANCNKYRSRPSKNLEDGELVSQPNVPDFNGLEKCGIDRTDISEFYKDMQKIIKLKDMYDKCSYDPAAEHNKFVGIKDQLVNSMNGLLNLVKLHAEKYSSKGGKKKRTIIRNLYGYFCSLDRHICACIDSLTANPELSEVDKIEVYEAKQNYKEDPDMNILYFNNSNLIPLSSLVVKLGEAKIIHLYTGMLLLLLKNGNSGVSDIKENYLSEYAHRAQGAAVADIGVENSDSESTLASDAAHNQSAVADIGVENGDSESTLASDAAHSQNAVADIGVENGDSESTLASDAAHSQNAVADVGAKNIKDESLDEFGNIDPMVRWLSSVSHSGFIDNNFPDSNPGDETLLNLIAYDDFFEFGTTESDNGGDPDIIDSKDLDIMHDVVSYNDYDY